MHKTILAVDDDHMIHKLLSFALEDEGNYQLESKSNAQDAKTYLEANHQNIDAIIMDWEMPGMTGIDFLEWQKHDEKCQDIPVIMLTGNNKKEDIKMGIDAGAYYYLIKPFNKDLLKSILNAAINDYIHIKQLIEQVKRSQNPIANLEEGVFKIKTLEEASRLSVLVSNTCPNPQEALIICELFNNAIEHGNLGITYEEKSALLDTDKLTEEVERRLNDPEYKDHYATVHFLREPGQLKITVEDMGDGFDFKKYLTFDTDRVFDSHGRGIAMVNSIFNVKYIGKGNKVELRIPTEQAN